MKHVETTRGNQAQQDTQIQILKIGNNQRNKKK